MRAREGRASFDSEKQNEPLDPDECLFRPESFVYWDDEYKDAQTLVQSSDRSPRIVAAWDPSLGADPRRGDHSAIVVLAHWRDPKRYDVLAADIARHTPAEAIERLVQYCAIFGVKRIAVEANGFQELLADRLQSALDDAGHRASISEVRNSGHKRSRISALQPLVEHGMVRFSRRQTVLIEQLRQFPLGAHDDGPDALEIGIQIPDEVRPNVGLINPDTGEIEWANDYDNE
jgi:predicted phage terminase large subunit-like protein